MKRHHIESSALRSAGFDDRRRVLELKFADGDVYEYADVPKSVYKAFLAAPSKGTFFAENIRDQYPFRKKELIPPDRIYKAE